MPKTLDVLIGLATIMLFFSLAVTTITQIIVNLLNVRGKTLLTGIVRLLQQIWPQLNADHAGQLANYILSHPAIALKSRLGNVVHREELVLLLLEAAAGETPAALNAEVRNSLLTELAQSGITNPETVLAEIRTLTQQLELLRPDLSSAERHTQAILKAASGKFIAKLFGWFDQTIDRVSELFTQHTRVISFCGAILITAAFQIDTVWITQRLSTDEQTRVAVVAQADALLKKAEAQQQAEAAGKQAKENEKQTTSSSTFQQAPSVNTSTSPPQAASPQEAQASAATSKTKAAQNAKNADAVLQEINKQANDYAKLGLIQPPFNGGFRLWVARFSDLHVTGGCLITVLLLSLGAPFWYDALKNLIRLKSVLASRDDDERQTRQSTQTTSSTMFTPVGTPSSTATTTPAFDLAGERGDLTALG